jgi:hypothetical protein
VRRLFWLGLGVAVGVLAVRRVSRFTRAWTTPQGLAEQAVGLGDAARGVALDFADEVRATAARREAQLRAELGLTTDATRAETTGGDTGPHPYVDDVDHDKDGH